MKVSALLAGAALLLSGCAGGSSSSSSSQDSSKIKAIASFYPLVYLTERIGGDAVEVTNLTPSGEAHDVELSARDTTNIANADAVVYLSGFQSAVDKAIAEAKPKNLLDVADDVQLVLASKHESEADESSSESSSEASTEADHDHDHDHEDGDSHDHGLYDPHFWLDPVRYELAIDPIVKTLSAANSAQADTFKTNGEAVKKDLEKLNEDYSTGLKSCKTPTIIAAHEAYGYMADRYGFKQVGVKGIDPEAESSISRLEEVAKVARENNVSTLFSESALNDADTKTLANQLGIQTKVLDPIEVQVDKNKDYLAVMKEDLASLKEAMQCS